MEGVGGVQKTFCSSCGSKDEGEKPVANSVVSWLTHCGRGCKDSERLKVKAARSYDVSV